VDTNHVLEHAGETAVTIRHPFIMLLLLIALTAQSGAVDLGASAPAKPFALATPPPVDPESIRQGGDTILDAIPVTIGFSGSGTTVGYTDDYDEVCPYDGSTSPDVVYVLEPSVDTSISIDMLGSTYDTKIYVYDGELQLVACNEDYYPDYVSRLEDVPVTGGGTYYVVIDGYGGDAGDYVVSIEEWFAYEAACWGGFEPQSEENEPPLVDDYADDYNGGCNSPEFGNPMQTLPVEGNCFHGRSGWYQNTDGSTSRDTDWFTYYALHGHPYLELAIDADWPCYFFVLGPNDCDTVGVVESWTFGGPAHGDLEISWPVVGGEEYWLWVGPTTFEIPPGGENEFDYFIFSWGDLPVEQHSWSSVKGLFD